MGREVKRVALDFDWPLRQTWEGYINPHYTATKCTACDGKGWSPEYKALEALWYGNAPFKPEDNGSTPYLPTHPPIRQRAEKNTRQSPGPYTLNYQSTEDAFESAVQREARRLCRLYNGQWGLHLNQMDVDVLIEDDRLWDFTRVPRTPEQIQAHEEYRKNGGGYWMPESNGYRPTAQEVNDWAISGGVMQGHDAINAYLVIKARCQREGMPFLCTTCNGECRFWPSPEAKELYDNWEKVEPPAGEGWQMWETVSGGSPISPVCQSPEALASWLSENEKSSFGFSKPTYFQWLAMIHAGWSPSLVIDSDGVKSGVQAVAELEYERHQ